jgi:glycosyltransferase involved in cell wall biosynthesis
MKVLHVPFGFVPGSLGGTEIYVQSLCRELQARGVQSVIAAPAARVGVGKSRHESIEVWEFGTEPQPSFESAYGRPDRIAAANFRAVLDDTHPDVVHLHARTAAVSSALVRACRDAGKKVVFTYHTPTVSCARGTMMYMGSTPCDGRVDTVRCTRCVLHKHGLHRSAPILARTPRWIGDLLARVGLRGGPFTALRMRSLVAARKDDLRAFLSGSDKVVAVCDWVSDVLLRNGVEPGKVVVSRQGLAHVTPAVPAGCKARTGAPLRLRYFGRLEEGKGLHVLVRALSLLPDLPVTLDIFGVQQGPEGPYEQAIRDDIAADSRIQLHPPISPERVVVAMRDGDLVMIPSVGMETGPLVVLEAHASGVPVLASRLGGIAELVRDDTDGMLVEAGNAQSWADAIASLARDPATISRLGSGIRPPRTMKEVSAEMAALYESIG